MLTAAATATSAAASASLIAAWDGLPPSRHAEFLAAHWQKQPLLVRGLLSPEEVEDLCPLTPADLVDLAGDADACSRLVLESGGSQPWELRHGPFLDPGLLELMESGSATCSLLVQQVDQLVPEVGRLRERFDFIPRWRADDVMVSFAPTGGSVGAHVDNYDVILVQGAGERRWSVEAEPSASADRTAGVDAAIAAGADALVSRRVAGGPPGRRRCARACRCACSPSSARANRGCSSRATRSTCRRATRTTASPSTRTA